MSRPTVTSADPRADVTVEAGVIVVAVAGTWSLRHARPDLTTVERALRDNPDLPVSITAGDLGEWDSSLVLFVDDIAGAASRTGALLKLDGLPDAVVRLVDRLRSRDAPDEKPAERPRRMLLTTRLGLLTGRVVGLGHERLRFFGECVLAIGRVFLRPFSFRWGEALEQMRRCGAAALPIVGLISMLVGVTLAFVAAAQLRQFGADIFVADLIGLAVLREMGPMMAAIVLTGRTGAAFAAELANMVLGEEVDALETFGVRSMDFLVAPRMLALLLMMPLLAIYADFLGVIGGALIAQGVLDIVPQAFFAQMQGSVGLNDIGTGLLKSVVFGWIIAFSGCYRGMHAERSSVGVGEATTGAVVMGILLIIVADTIFTVVFNALGW